MTQGRIRRLVLSYATAGLSKSVAAGVQIVALPIVASSLGSKRFGALMVLGAIGGAFCMPARGIPPSISIGVAHCRAQDDTQGVASQVWGGAAVSIALGVIALIFSFLLMSIVGVPRLLGVTGDRNDPDFAGGVAALLVLILATYGFAWVEGVRTGYEQNHINNIFSLAGSMLALASIILARVFAPTLTAFFLAIYVTYPVVQLVNLLLVRHSVPKRGQRDMAMRSIARRSFSWSIAQAGIVLNLQGTVWLAAHAAGLTAGGLVGAIVRLFQIVSSLSLALLTPVLPTLRHSVASGDRSWSFNTLRVTTIAIAISLFLFGAAIALLGHGLVRLWLGFRVEAQPLVFAGFGVLAVANIAPQLFYLVMMALGSSKAASLNVLTGGLFGIVSGLLAMKSFGLPGLIWGQALGMFVFACIPNTALMLKRLRIHDPVRSRSKGNFPDDKIST